MTKQTEKEFNHEEYQITCPRCDAYDELDDSEPMEQTSGNELKHPMQCKRCGFKFVELMEFKYWRLADPDEDDL